MTDPIAPQDADDADLQRVLRGAGPRVRPPAEVERAVRANLRAEWQAMVAVQRQRRRTWVGAALAAGIAVLAVGAWLALPAMQRSSVPVAQLVVAHGQLRVVDSWASRWRAVANGEALHAGQELMTGPESRGALELPGGLSLRLDHETRVAIKDAGHFRIERGAVYVDAGADARRSGDFEIGTFAGTIRHLGTQYEVRVVGDDVRVRVREGRIELARLDAPVTHGQSGEQLTISRHGEVRRAEMPPHDADWGWAAAVSPGFEIDGRGLPEFLAWVGREIGRQIVYASPAVAAAAASIQLNGTVMGLAPDQALPAVIATTRLHATVSDAQILITASAEGR